MPSLKVAQATSSPGSTPSQRSNHQSSQRSTKPKAKKVKKVKKKHSSPGHDDEILDVEAEELTELRTVLEDAAEGVTEDAFSKETASAVATATAETAGMEAGSEAVSSVPKDRQSHAAERFKPSWHRMLWSGHIARFDSMAVVSVS